MQVSARSVYVLLIASCLSLLGFTMPSPALPLIRSQFDLEDWQTGLVSSSMSLGMLFAVLFWPGYSDSMGRRKVLMISLFSTSVLFGLQVWVLNQHYGLRTFLAVRCFTGLFAGCNPIFKAYLADVVPSERLPRFMVFREASATLAFIIGPTVGGYLTKDFGIVGPFVATCLAHLAGAILLSGFVEEAKQHSDEDIPKGTGHDDDEDILSIFWKVVDIFLMSFCYVVSQTCFTFFIPLLLHDCFGYTPQGIGIFLTVTSIIVLTNQVVVYKPLEKRLGLEQTGCLGAISIVIGLWLVSFQSKALLYTGCLFYAFGSATFPATVPTLLAKSVPKHHRGIVLGWDSVMNNVGRVLTPLCLGLVYGRSKYACFLVGGCASGLVTLLLRRRQIQTEIKQMLARNLTSK